MQNINSDKYKKLYNKVKKLLKNNTSAKNKAYILADHAENKSPEQYQNGKKR